MSEADRLLVLITGTGRSGTSTMSGSFHHLGLHVPGPYLGANESNPKGFFESRFAMRFHKELLDSVGVNAMDSRPTALAEVRAAITPQHQARLEKFLAKVGEGHDQVVVKDPRSVWTQLLWRDAAAAVGRDIRYVSMLRHPAETIGSRATYYASDEADRRRRYEIFNISRWINNQLINERETRGTRRSFVRYTDLLEDWRLVATRLADELGLTYPVPPSAEHHPVDDFIEPDLRRVRVTWDDLEIPPALQAIADEVWQALNTLHDNGGVDDAASAELDQLAERYRVLFDEASAISHDAAEGRLEEAKRAGAAAERERLAAERPVAAPAGAPRIDEVGGRDLVKEAGRRLVRKVRRRGGVPG